MTVSRRKFLGWLGAAGLGAATGSSARAATGHFSGFPGSYGVLHDTDRCIGCRLCAIVCPDVAIEVAIGGVQYLLVDY